MVLPSSTHLKQNKVALRMIAIQDESLKLDKEIMPVVFTIKSK
jgi:hypothetical protein